MAQYEVQGVKKGGNEYLYKDAAARTSIGDVSTLTTEATNLAGAVNELDSEKVDKVSGKGLSTNDYTTAEKTKLAGIAEGANVNVQADWNQTTTTADDYIKNKPTVYTQGEVDNLLNAKLDANKKGAANGVAELDENGKVPTSQLPSYVDDVIEAASMSAFPATGEAGKIYVALDTNKTYRWGGSAYVEISESLALGDTSSTAFRGDYGKALKDTMGTGTLDTTAQTVIPAINELAGGKQASLSSTQLDAVNSGITAADVTKLSGIASGAEVNVQADWTEADNTSDAYIQNKPNLATVATSGSYSDLNGTPTIPDELADLSDDATHRLVTDTEKSAWNAKCNDFTYDSTTEMFEFS